MATSGTPSRAAPIGGRALPQARVGADRLTAQAQGDEQASSSTARRFARTAQGPDRRSIVAIKVLIVGDHAFIRSALAELLPLPTTLTSWARAPTAARWRKRPRVPRRTSC
jgi:hypothetical protein